MNTTYPPPPLTTSSSLSSSFYPAPSADSLLSSEGSGIVDLHLPEHTIAGPPAIVTLKDRLLSPHFRNTQLLIHAVAISYLSSGIIAGEIEERNNWFDVELIPLMNDFLFLLLLPLAIYRASLAGYIATFRREWVSYLLLAFLANATTIMFSQSGMHGSVMINTLSEIWTMVLVVFLSFSYLCLRYTRIHYTGLFLSILGAVALLFSEGLIANDSTSTLAADRAIIIGTSITAVGYVYTEYLLRRSGILQLFGTLPLFSLPMSLLYTFVFEPKVITHVPWSPSYVLTLVAISLFHCIYSLISYVCLQRAGSVAYSLGLFGAFTGFKLVFVFHSGDTYTHWVIVAPLLMLLGVGIFSLAPPRDLLEEYPHLKKSAIPYLAYVD